MEPVPGVRALFAVRAASLAWYLLSALLWSLPLGGNFELWFKIIGIIWLILSAAELAAAVPFSQGRQGSRAETAARALLITLAIGFVLTVVQSLPELGAKQMALGSSLSRSLSLVERAMYAAADVCLWLSLMRSLSQPPAWNGAFYTLLSLSLAISTLPLVMSPDEYFKLFHNPAASIMLRWGRVVVSVVLQALPLLLLRRLLAEGSAAPATAGAPVLKSSPGRDVAVGALWLGGGLLVTLISYSAASSSPSGGRYVVATGAIAYGIARLVRGFVKM